MDSGLEMCVLGAIEARRDGKPIAIGGPKPRLLLALLCAHRGSVVSADRMCEELWGDGQPADPTAVLQSHLSRLRAALRPEAEIVARPPGYALQVPDERIDAGRFALLCARANAAPDPQFAADALEAALACWQGPAFEEFIEHDWAQRESVRLDEQRAKAHEDLIEARLALGDHAELVGDLEALVAEHPLRERLWQQLIVALYRCGRSAEALRAATALRRTFRDELGLEPSPTIRELEARVLADDPTLLFSGGAPRSRPARRLPVDTTGLVGRDDELDEIMTRLRGHRLVTLTGPGGVGKTRLALRLANELFDDPRGEVFFAELAPVRDAASTVAAIATAVDVQQRQHLTVEETLVEYLRARRAWLVLDNCEHLRAAIAPLVDRLLAWCPDVSILATSREVLGLPSEFVWRVRPLAVAEPGANAAAVAEAPAVRLFVERAAAGRAGFTLDAENTEAVAEIVRRVDGLPLGIELAAARLRAMSPAALAERLEQRFDLLDGAQTSMIPRHRSLHDLVAWSHDLLDPEERRLFARLGVFAGGFCLNAAEGVCADEQLDPARVSSLLANLVDKSIVQLVDEDLPRYRLLETLRDFARDQLDAAEYASVRERHAWWFLGTAERAARMLDGPAEADAVATLDRDFDNLRTAHVWTVEHGAIGYALPLVAALREYAFRGMHAEIISWADAAIELPDVDAHEQGPVVVAMSAYGRFIRGDLEGAIALGERAIETAARHGTDSCGLAERALGNAFFYRGDVKRATEWMDRMVASARQDSSGRLAHALYMRSVGFTSVGDNLRGAQLAGEARAAATSCDSPTAYAQASYALGLALEAADPLEAGAHLQRAADLAHAAGNRWIEAFALTEVLWLEARQGNPREALARYSDVIETWYRGGDWANQWLSLRHVFGILVQLRAHLGAATLHGALMAAGAAYALPFEASDAEHLVALADELRARLGAPAFASAVRRGAALSDAEIIDFAHEQIRALSS